MSEIEELLRRYLVRRKKNDQEKIKLMAMRSLVSKSAKAEQVAFSWYRHLVVLSSGALILMVVLGKGASTPLDDIVDRIAVISLALSILLGSLLGHEEVRFARAHRDNQAIELQRLISGHEPNALSDVSKMKYFRTCEILFYLAMLVAMVSLIILAWHLQPAKT